MHSLLMKLKESLFSVTVGQIIAGMLGAVIILSIVHFTEPVHRQIGTVDITEIVNQFVQSQSKLNLPPQELQQRVNAFGRELQNAVNDVSKKEEATLIVQEAVVSGARNFTPMVKRRLRELQSSN